VNTRLVWVILFAVVVGLLAFFSLRSLQSGAPANALVVRLAATQQALGRGLPDNRFRVQLSRPTDDVRNLVVTIQPARTDSATIAALVDGTERIVREETDLSGFDSLVIAVFDRVVRTVPARDIPESSADSARVPGPR
jgi:hypothetical protein